MSQGMTTVTFCGFVSGLVSVFSQVLEVKEEVNQRLDP